MNLYSSVTYQQDLDNAILSVVNIEKLCGTSIMITGATGLIGSYIIDILMNYNKKRDANICIYAMSRSIENLKKRFDNIKTKSLIYIEHNVNEKPQFEVSADYIIHAASNAYPSAFHNDPVGTILSNILGTQYMLEYGKSHHTKKLLFVSSGEVYGQGDITLDSFEESYSGYIDSMQPRSCYPNSKRTAETLCSSYTKQFGLDTVIVRPCHTYGPNATIFDNRANVQFINSALNGKDIVLNSDGRQLRSYCYIADTASAILSVLINGKSSEAYNIANIEATSTIADFARIVAKQTGCKLIFQSPSETSLKERTFIMKQVLNSNKLEQLGWKGKFHIYEGIEHTLNSIVESTREN